MEKQELIDKWNEEIKRNKTKMGLYSPCQARYEGLKYENRLISAILSDVRRMGELKN